MRTLGIARCPVVVLAAAAALGCGTTPPSHFYTLDATATAASAPAGRTSVIVGPVTVPASVDRPEFVVRTAPNSVDVDEFNRWAAPLDEGIARVVAGDLVMLLGTPDVATAPFANFDAKYRVTIDVQRFESVPGGEALLEAVWVVHSAAGGDARAGRTLAREAAAGVGFDALAAAHSRALAQMSGAIAAVIRADVSTAH